MKSVAVTRTALGLIFAALLTVSAHASASAADRPIQFMNANSTNATSYLMMGEYDFNLYNRTNGWVLNGFYTKEDGKWSKNWLSEKLSPGEWVHMVWNAASNEGACVVPFKTTWDDYDKPEIYNLDWCKGIKNVYLKDTTFTVDYK